MKVLLLNHNTKVTCKKDQIPIITPPINLAYLAQSLIDAGHEVEIMDAYLLGLSIPDIVKRIKIYSPNLIGISLYSTDIAHTYNLSKEIKQNLPNIKIVLGGPHPTVMPTEIMKEFECVDFIIRGEGEKSIVDLANSLEKEKSLRHIKNISYRTKKKVIHNPCFDSKRNLDEIPFPARYLLDLKKYYMVLTKKNPTDVILTSRGCSFNCAFCSKVIKHCKFRSPDNVIKELLEIKSLGAKTVEIYDDNFTTNKKRCIQILDLIKKENLNLDLRIRSRVDNINNEILTKLKKVGCYMISYGIESANQHTLNKIRKGITLEQAKVACKKTNKIGIPILAYFIFGFPGETPKTINDTINLAIKLKPVFANFAILKPFPKTEIYNQAKKEGTLIGDYSIKNEDLPWVRLPWLKRKEDLYPYIDIAHKKFYHRTGYFFNKNVYKLVDLKIIKYALNNLKFRYP